MAHIKSAAPQSVIPLRAKPSRASSFNAAPHCITPHHATLPGGVGI